MGSQNSKKLVTTESSAISPNSVEVKKLKCEKLTMHDSEKLTFVISCNSPAIHHETISFDLL